MKYANITERLSSLGSEKWAVHIEGRHRAARGEKTIFLSIGEPDLPPPEAVLEVARKNIRQGRLRYAGGQGEAVVLEALARFYTRQTGRTISPMQFMFCRAHKRHWHSPSSPF
jgi:arginine:pyruvate transaminase